MKCVKACRLLQSYWDCVRWRFKQILFLWALISFTDWRTDRFFSLCHHHHPLPLTTHLLSFIISQYFLSPSSHLFYTLSFFPRPRRMTVCEWGRVTWCHLSTPQWAWRKKRGWAPARWPSSCCSLWWASSWASWSCRWQRSLVGRSMLSGERKQTQDLEFWIRNAISAGWGVVLVLIPSHLCKKKF